MPLLGDATIGKLLIKLHVDVTQFNRDLQAAVARGQATFDQIGAYSRRVTLAQYMWARRMVEQQQKEFLLLGRFFPARGTPIAERTQKGVASLEAIRAIARAQREYGGLANTFLRYGYAAQAAGVRIAFGLTLPLAALTTQVVRTSVEFDELITKIVTLGGVARDSINEFRSAILDLSRVTAVGPRALADAMYFVASAGFRSKQGLDIARHAAQAASMGMGDAHDIALLLVSAMHAWGKETTNVTRVMDVFIRGIIEANAEADAFAKTLGRVIPIASQLGAGTGLEEVMTFLAQYTRIGANAEQAVTALRGLLNAIAAPAAESRALLYALGKTHAELLDELRQKGLSVFLIDMVRELGGSVELLDQWIPNIRALSGLLATAGENVADYFHEIAVAIHDSEGQFAASWKEFTKSSRYVLNQFWADLERMQIALGDRLAEPLRNMLPLTRVLFSSLEGIVKAFALLGPAGQVVIVTFGLIAAAVGPLVWLIGNLGVALGGLLRAFLFIAGRLPLSALTSSVLGGTAAIVGMIATLAYGIIVQREYASETDKMAESLNNVADAANNTRAALRALGREEDATIYKRVEPIFNAPASRSLTSQLFERIIPAITDWWNRTPADLIREGERRGPGETISPEEQRARGYVVRTIGDDIRRLVSAITDTVTDTLGSALRRSLDHLARLGDAGAPMAGLPALPGMGRPPDLFPERQVERLSAMVSGAGVPGAPMSGHPPIGGFLWPPGFIRRGRIRRILDRFSRLGDAGAPMAGLPALPGMLAPPEALRAFARSGTLGTAFPEYAHAEGLAAVASRVSRNDVRQAIGAAAGWIWERGAEAFRTVARSFPLRGFRPPPGPVALPPGVVLRTTPTPVPAATWPAPRPGIPATGPLPPISPATFPVPRWRNVTPIPRLARTPAPIPRWYPFETPPPWATPTPVMQPPRPELWPTAPTGWAAVRRVLNAVGLLRTETMQATLRRVAQTIGVQPTATPGPQPTPTEIARVFWRRVAQTIGVQPTATPGPQPTPTEIARVFWRNVTPIPRLARTPELLPRWYPFKTPPPWATPTSIAQPPRPISTPGPAATWPALRQVFPTAGPLPLFPTPTGGWAIPTPFWTPVRPVPTPTRPVTWPQAVALRLFGRPSPLPPPTPTPPRAFPTPSLLPVPARPAVGTDGQLRAILAKIATVLSGEPQQQFFERLARETLPAAQQSALELVRTMRTVQEEGGGALARLRRGFTALTEAFPNASAAVRAFIARLRDLSAEGTLVSTVLRTLWQLEVPESVRAIWSRIGPTVREILSGRFIARGQSALLDWLESTQIPAITARLRQLAEALAWINREYNVITVLQRVRETGARAFAWVTDEKLPQAVQSFRELSAHLTRLAERGSFGAKAFLWVGGLLRELPAVVTYMTSWASLLADIERFSPALLRIRDALASLTRTGREWLGVLSDIISAMETSQEPTGLPGVPPTAGELEAKAGRWLWERGRRVFELIGRARGGGAPPAGFPAIPGMLAPSPELLPEDVRRAAELLREAGMAGAPMSGHPPVPGMLTPSPEFLPENARRALELLHEAGMAGAPMSGHPSVPGMLAPPRFLRRIQLQQALSALAEAGASGAMFPEHLPAAGLTTVPLPVIPRLVEAYRIRREEAEKILREAEAYGQLLREYGGVSPRMFETSPTGESPFLLYDERGEPIGSRLPPPAVDIPYLARRPGSRFVSPKSLAEIRETIAQRLARNLERYGEAVVDMSSGIVKGLTAGGGERILEAEERYRQQVARQHEMLKAGAIDEVQFWRNLASDAEHVINTLVNEGVTAGTLAVREYVEDLARYREGERAARIAREAPRVQIETALESLKIAHEYLTRMGAGAKELNDNLEVQKYLEQQLLALREEELGRDAISRQQRIAEERVRNTQEQNLTEEERKRREEDKRRMRDRLSTQLEHLRLVGQQMDLEEAAVETRLANLDAQLVIEKQLVDLRADELDAEQIAAEKRNLDLEYQNRRLQLLKQAANAAESEAERRRLLTKQAEAEVRLAEDKLALAEQARAPLEQQLRLFEELFAARRRLEEVRSLSDAEREAELESLAYERQRQRTELERRYATQIFQIEQARLGYYDALSTHLSAQLSILQEQFGTLTAQVDLAIQLDALETDRLLRERELLSARIAELEATKQLGDEYEQLKLQLYTVNLQLSRGPQHLRQMRSQVFGLGAALKDAFRDVLTGLGTGTGTLRDAVRNAMRSVTGRMAGGLADFALSGLWGFLPFGGGGAAPGLTPAQVSELAEAGLSVREIQNVLRAGPGGAAALAGGGGFLAGLGQAGTGFLGLFGLAQVGRGRFERAGAAAASLGGLSALSAVIPKVGTFTGLSSLSQLLGVPLAAMAGVGGALGLLGVIAQGVRNVTGPGPVTFRPGPGAALSGLVGGVGGGLALGALFGTTVGGPIGALLGGLAGAIAGSLGTKGPTTEKLAGRGIADIFGYAGIPLFPGRFRQGVSLRPPGVPGSGVPFPYPATFMAAETARSLLGVSDVYRQVLKTRGVEFPRGPYELRFAVNALRNAATTAQVSVETLTTYSKRFIQHLFRDYGDAENHLIRWYSGQAARSRPFVEQLALMLELFDKLPKAADAATVAAAIFTREGLRSPEKLARTVEDVSTALTQGVSDVLDALLDTDPATTAGKAWGEAFGSALIARVKERILAAPLSTLLTGAMVKLTEAAEALAAGDRALYERLVEEGITAYREGQRNVTTFLLGVAGPLRSLTRRLGMGGLGGVIDQGGLLGFAEGGVIPGPPGMARLVVAHAGEEVVTAEDRRTTNALLRGILDALESGKGATIVVQPAPVYLDGRVIHSALETNVTRQRTGLITPQPVGIARR